MSRPRIQPHASSSSTSSATQTLSATGSSSIITGLNFFSRSPSDFLLHRLFPYCDLRSLAHTARTGHALFDLPLYKKQPKDFHRLKQNYLRFVATGRLHQVELMITTHPELLLEKGHVTASSGQKMFGTGLGLAIMTEDFGREGCDLCLLPSPADGRLDNNTTLVKLSLYSDDNALSPFTYQVNGRRYTIGQESNEGDLAPEHFQTLKAMYGAELLLQNQPLNLSHAALDEERRQAYSAVLKITSVRKHTLFVKEEGMYGMLERHIRKYLPIDGEQVIAKEWSERLKHGWEERKAKKLEEELTALRTVREAIANSRTDADCEEAIQTFIKAIKPKGIIKEGFQWNKELLDAAFELGYEEYFYDSRKDDLFYNRIIASIQDIAPDNAAMAQAQGVDPQYEGDKFKRSLKFRYGDGSYFTRGSDSWVDCYYGVARWPVGEGVDGRRSDAVGLGFFQNYLRAKTAVLQQLMPPPDNHSKPRSSCVVM
ncbi:MAG: hypothetical protein V4501_09490 [Pseudomonadota bacterium]